MADPIVFFEIVGGDPRKQQRFYADLFGWDINPIESTGGSYATVGGAGIRGGVGAFKGTADYVTVYVRSDDPAATLERAKGLGGKVVMEPREVSPGVTAAVFRDPAGHMVGLMRREDT